MKNLTHVYELDMKLGLYLRHLNDQIIKQKYWCNERTATVQRIHSSGVWTGRNVMTG